MTITCQEWKTTYLFCFACGRTSFRGEGYAEDIGPWRLECHHIARGNHRAKALDEPAAWFQACQGLDGGCHSDVIDGCPVVVQLAAKLIGDPEHYDRERVNQLRSRAKSAITSAEVEYFAAKLRRGVSFSECRQIAIDLGDGS